MRAPVALYKRLGYRRNNTIHIALRTGASHLTFLLFL